MKEADVRYDIGDVGGAGKPVFLSCQISIYVLIKLILTKGLDTFVS